MMLDTQTLSYMEAARTALGLALRLERVSRTRQVRSDDIASLQEAVNHFSSLGSQATFDPDTTLYATPEGLGVMIHAAEEITEFRAGGLKDIVRRLKELLPRLQGPAPSIDDDVRAEVDRLREFFQKIHDIANEVVAFGSDSAPMSSLERALASQ